MVYKCLGRGEMIKTDRSYELLERAECHARAFESQYGERAFNSKYMEDEDEDSDVGCIACGNPAYPHCKTSCPLFDD